MAKKASALSMALSGAPVPSPAVAAPSSSKLDPAAFPCLYQDDQVAGQPGDQLPSQFAALDLKSVLVGSAPHPVKDNAGLVMADYELNPRKRRGGEERIPGAAEAAMGTSLGRSGSLQVGSLQSNFIGEAVIGSLPKGLTDLERSRIRATVPPSPSAGVLKELNSQSVTSRTPEGQKLRRGVLRGCVMVFVTAGYSGKRFIFEKAKELGVRSIVIDGPDSWARSMEKEGVIQKFIGLDFTEAETVFERCLEAIKKASKLVGEIDGITTFCEMAVPLCSRLAEQLNLPHNSVQSVDAARDKYMTRDLMEKAGLPTPRHYRITTPEDLPKAGAHVGYPAVIKPVSGAASIGVIRVNNDDDLLAAYNRVTNDMKKARIVAGALVEGDEEDESAGNAGTWIQLVLMLEEYLDGTEVDCDLIFQDGAPVYGAITDNWPTVEPYFNETGSNCPSTLPRTAQAELLELSVRSVQSLGLRLGVFHVECKYTTRGARLIEVNCRMGGGPVRDTNLIVWGVDLVEEHLMTCAGIPSRPLIAKRPLKQIAEYSINAQVSGTLKHTNFLDSWKPHPDVMYARPLVEAGHKCVCVEDGLPTWVCEMMVEKPTVQEAIDFIKSIEQSLEIPIEQGAHHHHH